MLGFEEGVDVVEVGISCEMVKDGRSDSGGGKGEQQWRARVKKC